MPWETRLDHAHRRYLASIQALARANRLLAPTIAQVNIAAPGSQQLNQQLNGTVQPRDARPAGSTGLTEPVDA